MAKRGYIHRDISAGNILIYNGRAKLADLEFAKEYGAGQSSYVRTVCQPHKPLWSQFAHAIFVGNLQLYGR